MYIKSMYTNLFIMQQIAYRDTMYECNQLFAWSRRHRKKTLIQYILVIQCFLVGYREICHASLVFSAYIQAFR